MGDKDDFPTDEERKKYEKFLEDYKKSMMGFREYSDETLRRVELMKQLLFISFKFSYWLPEHIADKMRNEINELLDYHGEEK